MIKKLLLPPLAAAINAYLKLDEASAGRLRRLNDKVISIELLPLKFSFQCVFRAAKVELVAEETLPADAKIQGTPLQMMGVVLTKENRHTFFAEDISITGDAEIAEQVIKLFDELAIDWEEYLSHLTGDVAAHHASRWVRKTRDWLSGLDRSFSQDVSEYLQEEAKLIPSKLALQDLFEDIDNIRMDVDRLLLRVKRIEDAINAEEAVLRQLEGQPSRRDGETQ